VTVSAADAAQLYDCRIALEQLSVQAACQHVTESQLQAMEALVIEAEQLTEQSMSEQHSPHMLDLDHRFHRSIAESSINQWLVCLLEQVFSQMALLRVQTTRHNPEVLEIRTEHRQIYQAIAQRDEKAATQAIYDHLIASKQRVLQEVEHIQQAIEH
jgi:DNA-binding GntR family transcriptional regulator